MDDPRLPTQTRSISPIPAPRPEPDRFEGTTSVRCYAVVDRTRAYLQTVDAAELDRIIDRSYDPPVSVGVRLVSVISDNIQHAGQARYLRGIIERQV